LYQNFSGRPRVSRKAFFEGGNLGSPGRGPDGFVPGPINPEIFFLPARDPVKKNTVQMEFNGMGNFFPVIFGIEKIFTIRPVLPVKFRCNSRLEPGKFSGRGNELC
jgi:hypothetical protein